jgi:hypothetical protein
MKPALLRVIAAIAISPGIAWSADLPTGLRNPDVAGAVSTNTVVGSTSAVVVPVDAAQIEALDRGGYFIGNTIANLRGLDPTFSPRALQMMENRQRTPSSVFTTYSSKDLSLPASWKDAPVSERRSCGADRCSATMDLLITRADGSTQLLATGVTGSFLALPHSHRIVDCANEASVSQPAIASIVDLHGARFMLPPHPGPVRTCADAGTGDEVLLVYLMAGEAGKTYTLARVVSADGVLIAERKFRKQGKVKFRADGKRYSEMVSGPE